VSIGARESRPKEIPKSCFAICKLSRPNPRNLAESVPSKSRKHPRNQHAWSFSQGTNALRGHLAELGVVAAQGRRKVATLIEVVCDESDARLPPMARQALAVLVAQIRDLQIRIKGLERALLAWHRSCEESRRLESIPGVGFITATALTATVSDPTHFKSGRQFAAWLGLTPRQNSSGDKERLGRISKMGDRYLRRLLVVGATALIRFARNRSTPLAAWADALLAHRPARLVSVALANKIARIVWALLSRGETYRRPAGATA
jgi:transposase